jgi:hypothetical protein
MANAVSTSAGCEKKCRPWLGRTTQIQFGTFPIAGVIVRLTRQKKKISLEQQHVLGIQIIDEG